MAQNKGLAEQKIEDFFRTAFRFHGKEIGLTSNQTFMIDQIRDPEKEAEGIYRYVIQYGFPQSGSVIMNCSYEQKSNEFFIDGVAVYAPPADKDMTIVNLATKTQIGEMSIGLKIGVDSKTEEYKTPKSINSNPNALEMLDIAIADLREAKVLGECYLSAPTNSKRIPCCDSRHIEKDKTM